MTVRLRREECVDTWVPKDQWNVILQSVAASGDLPSLNVTTAEMEVQLESGVLVRRLHWPASLHHHKKQMLNAH